MKSSAIPGFDRVQPTTGFALAVFGPDGSGKTRLIAQMQAYHEARGAETACIVLDAKTRDTLKLCCAELGCEMPLTNTTDYVTPKQAMEMALVDETSDEGKTKIKRFYADVNARIFKDAVTLAGHANIAGLSFDPFTEFYDYIFFEHFGRKNQIPALSRTAPNQQVIDLVKAARHKDLILTHRQGEIWAATGKTDTQGNAVKEPSGRFKLQGYNDIGYQVSCVLQLKKNIKKIGIERFSVDVQECQKNVALAGEKDYWHGEDISYDGIRAECWPDD